MRNWQAGNEIITFPNNLKDEEEDRKGFINPLKKVVKQPQEVKVGPGRWPFEPTYLHLYPRDSKEEKIRKIIEKTATDLRKPTRVEAGESYIFSNCIIFMEVGIQSLNWKSLALTVSSLPINI